MGEWAEKDAEDRVRCSFYLDKYIAGRADVGVGMGMGTAKSFLLSPSFDTRITRAVKVNCFIGGSSSLVARCG